MKLHHLNNRGVHGYTTFGSVWDRGEAHTSHFTLMDVNQKRIPVQSKVTAYWPDGSIKWAAHTADAALMGEECELLTTGEYEAKTGEEKAETVITGATGSKITGNEADEEDIMPRIAVTKTQNGAVVDTGRLRVEIPGLFARETTKVNALVDEIRLDGKKRCGEIFPVMYLEHPAPVDGSLKDAANGCMEEWTRKTFCRGEIESVELEEQGSLQCVIVYRGRHREYSGSEKGGARESRLTMPFVIRLYLWAGSAQMKLVHTFLFDGEEERDRLKGLGIRFNACLEGEPWERMVQFVTDGAHFKEPAMKLFSNHPRVGEDIFSAQLEGKTPEFAPDSDIARAVKELPVWNRYGILQDSAYHYHIYKQTHAGCCRLSCGEGRRTEGCMAVSDMAGGVALSIRDFWQKYPSGLEVSGLGEGAGCCTAWFYSPEAESFDFSHYDTRSYPRTSYEGFDEVRSSAYGIGVTSECRVDFFTGQIEKRKWRTLRF